MTTFEEIQNTEFQYVTELTFDDKCLDAQTLCNIFFQAVVLSQTATSPQADIIRIEEKDNMRIVVFSNPIAQSNMKNNFERLVQERLPEYVQNALGFELRQSTNKYPKAKVA